MHQNVEKVIDAMTDEEKAVLAAEILNECNPNKDVMAAFIATLEETVNGELYSRLAQHPSRDD